MTLSVAVERGRREIDGAYDVGSPDSLVLEYLRLVPLSKAGRGPQRYTEIEPWFEAAHTTLLNSCILPARIVCSFAWHDVRHLLTYALRDPEPGGLHLHDSTTVGPGKPAAYPKPLSCCRRQHLFVLPQPAFLYHPLP